MLQRGNAESVVYDSGSVSPQEGGLGELIDLAFGFLRRQYLIILFFTLITAGAGPVYLAVTAPTYTARAKVIIGTQRAQFIQQQSIFTDGPIDSAQLESQLQVLQSKNIASSVLEKLRLVDDPEFAPSRSGSIRGWIKAIASSVVEKLSVVDDPEFAASPGGSILASIRGMFAVLSNLDATKPNLDAKEAAMAAFADQLTVSRVGLSHVIEISFSSRSPERAAQIANTVANVYILDQLEAKRESNRTAGTWLQERLQQLSVQSAKAELAVLEFKQQNNIVATDGKRVDEQQVTDLNARLVAARAQTSDLLARLNRIETIVRAGINGTFDGTVSDVLTSPILSNLRQQYLDLTRREADWSTQYGRNHSAVVALRNRIRDIRSSTFEEVQRLAESYKSDYEIAKQRQEQIEKQLAEAVSRFRATDTAQVRLQELENAAKGYRDLYDAFRQRHIASIQQESFPIAETRLISPASTPTSKSKPKTTLVLALAIMGGIGLGLGVGLLRELADRVFRTTAQLQAALQMPCLALVPLLKDKGRNQLRRKQKSSGKVVDSRTIARDSGVHWTAVECPFSAFAESIRSLKLAINLNVTSRRLKVIGVTSSLPNEGKTTIAAALAQLTAEVGNRVIMVDCDFRNPSLSRNMARKATVGLLDVISGERTLEEAAWRDPTTNLVLLPLVRKAPMPHPSELLAAESTRKLFDELRATFDYIIVDLPPLAPVVDVRAVTHVVDCMILVVEWGHTKIDVVQHALNTAPNVHEALLGAVLNKTDMDHIGRYDAPGASLYHSKYYTK
jgi:polysaccharide biosynthesis transport protein